MPLISARRLVALALLVTASCGSGSAGAAGGGPAGSVRFVKTSDASFDVYTRSPTAAQRAFMRAHYWRIRANAPYFDSRLSWAPGTWVYQDAYAIYPSSAEAAQHPEWILQDASGNKLWIQFGCRNGRCTQYAADIGNPEFRAWWIRTAKARIAAGYKGVFIDDVNMAERVSNGDGVFTAPIDPRSKSPIDEAEWQREMAAFMVEIRAALPKVEIVHNALWPMGDGSADLRRQLGAADYIELERGFNDPGIVGGSGRFGFHTLLDFITRRHGAGQGVILAGRPKSDAARVYGLAGYLLVTSGRDGLVDDAAGTPDSWWRGYDVRLGAALTGRYRWRDVWRRDFTHGIVLVNEPGAPARRVAVRRGLRDLSGAPRRTVTLGPASGVVLLDKTSPRHP
jgi:hypothetical protein